MPHDDDDDDDDNDNIGGYSPASRVSLYLCVFIVNSIRYYAPNYVYIRMYSKIVD